MGFGVQRFVCKIDQNLLCSICSCVLEDPVLTPCGHSFCLLCLETWLSNSGSQSCPECRGRVGTNESKPILAIKNLINNLGIHCDHVDKGCKTVVRLEKLEAHLEDCGYVSVECAGCNEEVNRCDLADHQLNCSAIAAVCDDEVVITARGSFRDILQRKDKEQQNEITALTYRVAGLELQLKKMKRDLQSAEVKNKETEKELKRTQQELEEKRNLLTEERYYDFDPDYTYGYSPISIPKLSCLIAKCLLRKPSYVDRDEIFLSVKRCYDRFGRRDAENEVHMLIATAYASNWFTDNQKLQLQYWLQNMTKFRNFQPVQR